MIGKMVRKSLFKNIRITLWTLVILTISAALITMFATVSFDIEKRMGSALRKLGPNAVAVTHFSGSESHLNLNAWGQFRDIVKREGIPATEVSFDIVTVRGKPVVLAMADPEELAQMTPYWIVMGRRAQKERECLIGQRCAELLKLKPGASIMIHQSSGAEKETIYRIVGVIVSGDENEDRIFVPGQPAETIQSGFTYALLSVSEGEKGIEQINKQLAQLQSHIEIKPLREIVHGEETTLKKVVLLFSASLMTVLILTVLGVSSALLSRIVERRKEFALLQAIGATRRSVVSFLLLEGTTLAVLASGVGFVAGTLLSGMVVRQIFHVSVTPQIAVIPITFIVTLAVSLLASTAGVTRTLKMQPALVLKGE